MKIHPKKSVLAGAMLALTLAVTTACAEDDSDTVEGKVNVVTTIYPIYYLAEQIGGDDASVVNMIAAGVEPHDWTPKSRDLTRATNAQLFIYNGAGFESWVDHFLPAISDGNAMTVEASEGITLIDSEGEEEEHHEDGHDHDHGDFDPHTWVSPRSMLTMAENVKNAFVAVDPDNAADYEARYAELNEKLEALDDKFTQGLAPYAGRDIIVSHQSFGYLCRDYGLHQIAIMGLSPNAEPRAQDLLEISEHVKAHGINTIFFEDLVSDKLAKTLASEAGVDTMVLSPIEGLTPEQEKAGENYITLMERNLLNLQKALQ